MPTGYTYSIKDGITFEHFALKCARAFGALIHMRDESMDVEIPDKIEPDRYHEVALIGATEKLIRAKKMTLDDAKILSEKEYKEKKACDAKYLADKIQLQHKYLLMLEKVIEWKPPTSEHEDLKRFMKEQIESSIEFDCSTKHHESPKLLSPEEWLRQYIDKCAYDVGYHSKEWEAEKKRCADRTEWIVKLKESLKR